MLIPSKYMPEGFTQLIIDPPLSVLSFSPIYRTFEVTNSTLKMGTSKEPKFHLQK